MNYYYITGTSKGIGKALAELLLENEQNRVIGISRSCTIQHKHYTHLKVDLSDPSLADKIDFENHPDAEQLVLVNNAGAISETGYLGGLDSANIIADYAVNLISPAVLTNNFMKSYKEMASEKIIINISSGAGKKPVDGWGAYCSSKSGLDMLSKVIAVEQEKKHTGIKIFSIAPGIVDTEMQDSIRTVGKENFSRVADFISYKKNNELTDPLLVAKKLVSILARINEYPEPIFSLRD